MSHDHRNSYLNAKQAARLLRRCSFPEKIITDSLIRKCEYAIRIAASQRQNQVFWSVPVIYSAVPAYNYVSMQKAVTEHLRKEGFYVKTFPDGITCWISWRFAYEALKLEETKNEKKSKIA